jgi:hypothetical protein
LRSGAYFAIHSGVSQCLRQASAARGALLDGRIVHNDGTRLARRSWLGAMDVIEPFEQGDTVRQELGTALRFCCEVTTVSFQETKSSAPIMAILGR